MSTPSRSLRCAIALAVALTATACGSDPAPVVESAETPAAEVPSGTPRAEAPTTPEIAEPTVAPTPTDPSAVALYGEDGITSAYREVVELATVHAFDPDYFFRDGDNSGASLDEVSKRLTPEQGEYLRAQADACAAAVLEACGNVLGIVYFDAGSDEKPYTFRNDMHFVTEQTISNPRVSGVVPDLGASYLELSFDHTAHIRFVLDGTPATATMTRHEVYDLVPAPAGSGTRWLVSDWRGDYQGDLRDEVTGQPLEG